MNNDFNGNNGGGNGNKKKPLLAPLAPFYKLMYKVEYVDDKSKPFKLFCMVTGALSLILLIFGIVTSFSMVTFISAFCLFIIGVYFLMNNLKFKWVQFKAGRASVVFIVMFLCMDLFATAFSVTHPDMAKNLFGFSDDDFFNSDEFQQDFSDEVSYPSINSSYTYACKGADGVVYMLKPASDTEFNIEVWKGSFSDSTELKRRDTFDQYSIDDPEVDFANIDNNQLAFNLAIEGTKLSSPHLFTVIAHDDMNSEYKVNMGTTCDSDIICYIYRNDEDHIYKAVALNDEYIKIESWRTDDFYDYTWCVFNVNDDDMEFKWENDSHEAFSIKAKDPSNPEQWPAAKTCTFKSEDEFHLYYNVNDYLF